MAGTGNVRDADISRADDVILWSPFSDETSRIDVPQRLRYFARNYKPATEQVTVVVAKFDMGYWNMESFLVPQSSQKQRLRPSVLKALGRQVQWQI